MQQKTTLTFMLKRSRAGSPGFRLLLFLLDLTDTTIAKSICLIFLLLRPSKWLGVRRFSFVARLTGFKPRVGQINRSCHRLASCGNGLRQLAILLTVINLDLIFCLLLCARFAAYKYK